MNIVLPHIWSPAAPGSSFLLVSGRNSDLLYYNKKSFSDNNIIVIKYKALVNETGIYECHS